MLDCERCTTGLPEKCFQKQRGSAFALTEVRHQQRGERDQSRPGLPSRHTGRQRSTGRLSAARTGQPMPLILGHLRPDVGEFVDLMPQRFAIVTDQSGLTPSTLTRLQWHHSITLFGRYQRTFVFAMPWLSPPTLPLRLLLLSRRPGVGMLCARRRGRVLRRFGQPRLQLGQSLSSRRIMACASAGCLAIKSSVISSVRRVLSLKTDSWETSIHRKPRTGL